MPERSDRQAEITNVYSDVLGGRGYSRPPTVTLQGELEAPKEATVSCIALSGHRANHLLRVGLLYAPMGATLTKTMRQATLLGTASHLHPTVTQWASSLEKT